MAARCLGLAAILAVSALAQAAAEPDRTEQLVWDCEENPASEEGAVRFVHCVGYVGGMLDMHALMSDPRVAGGKPQFCLPKSGISNDQAIKVFLKWSREHPEQLHKSARISLLIALREAFPCP
jgi:hypothetical protein